MKEFITREKWYSHHHPEFVCWADISQLCFCYASKPPRKYTIELGGTGGKEQMLVMMFAKQPFLGAAFLIFSNFYSDSS